MFRPETDKARVLPIRSLRIHMVKITKLYGIGRNYNPFCKRVQFLFLGNMKKLQEENNFSDMRVFCEKFMSFCRLC